MANRTVTSRIILRNDTRANWESIDPVPLKGELCLESNTKRFKIGDGITHYTALPYASAITTQLRTAAPTSSDSGFDVGTPWLNVATYRFYILQDNSPGAAVWTEFARISDVQDAVAAAGDMKKSLYASNADSSLGYVDKAKIADKLSAAFTLSISGDGTGSENIDGSGNRTINFTLSNSGVTVGTYTKVTVDAKGRITSGALLAAGDVPTLTLSKISDAGTAASKNTGTAAGEVPVLGAGGKLDISVIPSLAITEIHVVSNEAAMLALTAQPGDVAVRTDIQKTLMLSASPASTLSNWIELQSPSSDVTTVNGKAGTVVLVTSDIDEGTNLYWTAARFAAAFETAVSETNLSDLADGAHALLDTDTLVLDGGDA